MDRKLTVLGGYGFVGDAFFKRSCGNPPVSIRRNSRDDISITTPNVVNFVSSVHNYNVFTDPFLDIRTNLEYLIDSLEEWRYCNDEHGVYNFISSWFVYGGEGTRHHVDESFVCDPRGFYAITKRAAEQLLISYCNTYDLRYRILRLGNVVGPGDKKVSAKKNALQYLVNEIKAGRDINIYGEGRFYRDYIHVEDVADAINLVLDKGKTNEIYNIGNGRSWNFLDILLYCRRIIENTSGTTSKFNYVPAKEFHQNVQLESFFMNTKKLQSLGYVPKYSNETLFDSLLA